VASDGVETMAFLRQEAAHADAPRPDLVPLDLNLPKMDGREILARLAKSGNELRLIKAKLPHQARSG
jgi:two-component system, chemotaxis family, response regulator Rcp1